MQSYNILIFGDTPNDLGLSKKLLKKTSKQIAINSFSRDSLANENFLFPKEVNYNSPHTVYIYAHGSTYYNNIIKNNGHTEAIEIDTLAESLIKNLSHLKYKKPSNITLNLIICFAAYAQSGKMSETLAAKLQQKLGDNEIYVDVVARIPSVIVNEVLSGRKTTVLFGNYEEYCTLQDDIASEKNAIEYRRKLKEVFYYIKHKQQLSKVTYTWVFDENGTPYQAVFDSYWFKEQKKYYDNFLKITNDIRKHGKTLEKRANETQDQKRKLKMENASKACFRLADNLEGKINSFFKSPSRDELELQKFKKECCQDLKEANKILKEHRDPAWIRICRKAFVMVLSGIANFGFNFGTNYSDVRITQNSSTLFSDITVSSGKINKAKKALEKFTPAPLLKLNNNI